MATKSEYLTALAAKSFIQEVGAPEKIEDFVSNIYTTIYKVQLLEKDGSTRAIPITHKFAVYKEGEGNETAFDLDGRYVPYFKENDSVYASIKTYLDNRSTVYNYRILDYNKDSQTGICKVWVYVTDHIEEKLYLVYNDSGITHLEITETV